MKNLIYFLIAFFFSLNSIKAAGLNDISSKNGTDVWAVGNNGNILYSVTGGNYWSRFFISNNNYNSVFTKSIYIWIAGDNGDLERSSNNGSTFSQITLPSTVNLNSIYFYDNLTGWIAGNSGTILKTTNGGINWSMQNSGTTQKLNTIKFSDANNGAVCGASGVVLITTNGGTNWNVSATPVSNDLLSIDIKGNNLMASGVNASAIKSLNKGISWSILDYKMTTRPDINSVYIRDSLLSYSVGGGGFIRKTTDAGATFKFLINPLYAPLNKIFFLNVTQGWCISKSTDAIIKTTDDGSSWKLSPGTTQSFSWELKIPLDYYISSGNNIATNPYNRNELLVTKSNTIYRSLDRGNNWSQISTISQFPYGSTSNSFIVSPKDTNVFLVAIDSGFSFTGKVFRSTNYGQTWTPTFSGNRNSDGKPLEMDPNHPDTVTMPRPIHSYSVQLISARHGLRLEQKGLMTIV